MYSAGAADCAVEAGYHIHTNTVRLVPGIGARSSVNESFVHVKLVRPTAKGPVGFGSVIGRACSHLTIATSTAPPRKRTAMKTPVIFNRFLISFMILLHYTKYFTRASKLSQAPCASGIPHNRISRFS